MSKICQAVFLILILAGCSSSQTASPTALTAPPVTGSSPTDIIPHSTESSIPTSSPTPVFTSAPTLTPLPTFPLESGMQTLQAWLGGTFDCLLPCWGGITPGKTTWQEARQLLGRMSGFSSIKISENMGCEFGGCNGIAWSLYPQTVAEGVFYTKLPENMVHLIKIDIQNEGVQKTNLLKNIKLQDVFHWYGPPDELLFTAVSNESGDSYLELIMVYIERQFIIRYVKIAETQEDKLVSCGRDNRIQLIILDNKEKLASLEAIASAPETRDLHINGRRKSFEEATGMTVRSFYVAVTNFRKEPCISTPVNLWVP